MDIVTVSDKDDLEFARRKYAAERDKRMRADGTKQFVKMDGDFNRFTADPFAPPPKQRDPLKKRVQTVIVGGGHAGLLAAVALQKAGRTDFLLIDAAADFGGTWYWNRYPGIRCDVDAYVYMPLLEEVGNMPSEKYASGVEIFENARKIGETFDLYSRALFQTHVREARWSDDNRSWTIDTDHADVIEAQYVIMALGPLNKPKLPGIRGLEIFKGHMFHTSRWDYRYTGGDSGSAEPKLDKLKDKRVAIIGTGCTGLQCAPRVAKYAKELYVVQRTPSAVNFRNNRPTDPQWVETLQPGWQQERISNFDQVMQGHPTEIDLVDDSWTAMKELMAATWASALNPDLNPDLAERVDLDIMNRLRNRVDEVVSDPEAASKLKSWYRTFCKRPTFSDNYLPMFNMANVALLDTNGKGPDEIDQKGLVIEGVHYDVDCIIFATGYEVGTDYCGRGGLQIYGREGLSLSEKWSGGMRTLYGYLSAEFPNCFHMGVFLQNSAFGSYTSVFQNQAHRILQMIEKVDDQGGRSIEITREAEEEWADAIFQSFKATESFHASCTPGYYNAEGNPASGEGIQFQQYAGGSMQFDNIVHEWVESGMPGAIIRD